MNSMNEPSAKVTPFQRRVYDAALKIPRGRISTYAELGRFLGCASARAIGQALRRNPFAPRVPCHRVVRSDGSLGGFNGATEGPEIERKIRLLEEEGVRLDGRRCVAPEQIFRFGR